MTEWRFDELRKLCNEQEIPVLNIYLQSLEWRWRRADFHAERAQETFEELMRLPEFVFGNEVYMDAMFKYEADVEACCQALHSLADILAQIINIVLLGSSFSEEDVTFSKVKREVVPDSSVRSCMDNFRRSNAFCYINGFCNTIKHRHLIHTSFRVESGGTTRNEEGFVFHQFIYRGTTFPETWGSDILKVHREDVRQLITNIGLSINTFKDAQS